MEIRVLGCSGGKLPGYNLTSFLIDDRLLLDAGSAASALSLDEQQKIETVLISHAHLDHVGELFFLASYHEVEGTPPLEVFSIPQVLAIIGDHFLNEEVWPDLRRESGVGKPVVCLRPLEELRWNRVGRFSVLPVRANHPTPTAAYAISDGQVSAFFTSDTGPSDTLWEAVRGLQQLRGVVIEVSFPNEMQETATRAGHLTPSTLAGELAKLAHPDVPVYLCHVKPGYWPQIRDEVLTLGLPKVIFMEDGESYRL